jgi:hypothetical protein
MNSWRFSWVLLGFAALSLSRPVQAQEAQASDGGPSMLTLTLGGSTTWRSYCMRPGVSSCSQFDAMPEGSRPAGNIFSFSSEQPYSGFGMGLAFFPLAPLDNLARGLGVDLAYSRGFSSTSTSTSGKPLIATDDEWHAEAAWRFYFDVRRERDPLAGYVGLRGGLSAHIFDVDRAAVDPLPGSKRRFAVAGVDISYPIARILRLEGSGSWFFGPGPALDGTTGAWAQATGQGWSAEAGIAGDLLGPIGYVLKFRTVTFKDHYTGAQAGLADRAVAEESFSSLNWGLTASF